MAKVHLMRNKNAEVKVSAVCASKSINGMTYNNSRSTYVDMSSQIVSIKEFVNVPEKDRCAHCVAEGLNIRNRQRRDKGLPPVSSLFEGK